MIMMIPLLLQLVQVADNDEVVVDVDDDDDKYDDVAVVAVFV